jgi:hypothetical protein
LESIPPTDDQAFEDRALACFVVACGELASMRDTGHRDTVVEQLTIVARKLVKANAGTYKPKVTPKPAQGLAQGLMRGLLGSAPKGRPARPPVVDISVDPPGLPAVDGPKIVAREEVAPGETAPHQIDPSETAQAVQTETIEVEAAQGKAARDKIAEDKTAQDETAQDETAQDETAQDEMQEGQTARAETVPVDGAETDMESPAALSWDQLEALIKKEVSEIAPDHETTSG